MTTTDKIIDKYIKFEGERSYMDFVKFHSEVHHEQRTKQVHSREYVCLDYIQKKLMKGMGYCIQNGGYIHVIIEDTIADIERGYDKSTRPQRKAKVKKAPAKKRKATVKKKRKAPKKSKGKDLGKIVDHGNVAPRGKSDAYWKRQGVEIVFKPNDKKVRSGENIPDTYKYADVRFVEDYYSLKAIEFGNWLSQQDRINYLSGLGLALFDLHKAIRFTPKQISIKGRLSVAFGARGRGKATAHFEPGTFAINLTRYSRPKEVEKRPTNFNRVDLILQDGGVGAFAHEYGHALDYYGGLHVEKGDTFSLSGDDSTDPKPNMTLLKKNTLKGLMEKLLYKIIWKTPTTRSAYYARLVKAATTDYYIQRNEIFARAFEVYVQYKLLKGKHKNVFLNKSKYSSKFYLSISEMKSVEKEFDALINAIKKHL